MVNILVTGSNGQLGSEFRAISAEYPFYHFFFTDIDELDITNKSQVMEFFEKNQPDVVINCAAFTAVDRAESEPEKAMWLNRDAVANLASACDHFDCFLVQISTDYVFDGKSARPYREDDIPAPVTVYGLTKLAGEEAIQACLQRGLIIRTSWLYSSFGNNFVRTILTKARGTGSLRVVSDQSGTPTYARDLAIMILDILPKVLVENKLLILHYSNEGTCSWYDFAREIIAVAGIDCKIEPVSTDEYKLPAPRPAFSALDKGLIRERYGVRVPGWKDSLAICLNRMKATDISAQNPLPHTS